ncbi:MAG: pirin family protein [Polyangiaceae bacterium]|nr:pirin family protein [Polyangiaceae bacterium]
MISPRRTNERHHDPRGGNDVWLTFSPAHAEDPPADGFGTLQSLSEALLRPGATRVHSTGDAEILTYVCDGDVAFADSTGRSSVVSAGEFRHLTTGRGVRYRETNASSTDRARLFQMRFNARESGRESSCEHRRFCAAERRRWPCVIASPDGRSGSLRIRQDAILCSALLRRGSHIVHELAADRRVWLHIVDGAVSLDELVLCSGDGAGIAGERAVSLTAQEGSEILLLDLGNEAPTGRLSLLQCSNRS